MAVRFGNVLGSSGSVIPIFHKQIAAGGPVKVTHPEMTRYFMTIPEAVGLVLQSARPGDRRGDFRAGHGQAGQDRGPRAADDRTERARPDEDIQIEFIGMRPGEKLFEELSNTTENHVSTVHPKIARFITKPMPFYEVKSFMDRLSPQIDNGCSPNDLKQVIRELVPEYNPYLS